VYRIEEAELNRLLNCLAKLEDRARKSPFFNAILSDPDAAEIRAAAGNLRRAILEQRFPSPAAGVGVCGKSVTTLDGDAKPCKLQAGHTNGCNPF
jgi:hypothetical protein